MKSENSSQYGIQNSPLFMKVQAFCEEMCFRSLLENLGMLNPKPNVGKLKMVSSVSYLHISKMPAKLKKKIKNFSMPNWYKSK